MKAYMQALFVKAADRIQLGFISGHGNASTCMPSEGFTYGVAQGVVLGRNAGARIVLAVELLAPLLNGRLTDAEIMVDRMRFVNTLLHETTVGSS